MEIDYRKELLKTFKDDAYWLVNKHLASHLGLVPTILLSELIYPSSPKISFSCRIHTFKI